MTAGQLIDQGLTQHGAAGTVYVNPGAIPTRILLIPAAQTIIFELITKFHLLGTSDFIGIELIELLQIVIGIEHRVIQVEFGIAGLRHHILNRGHDELINSQMIHTIDHHSRVLRHIFPVNVHIPFLDPHRTGPRQDQVRLVVGSRLFQRAVIDER